MPELPEVEAARRILDRRVVGRTILRARVPRSRVLQGTAPTRVARFLSGRRALAAERRGKHVLLVLEGGGALHLHLGMSGRLAWGPASRGLLPHARLVLELDDGSALTLRDPRMFGRVEIGSLEVLRAALDTQLGPDPVLDHLGPRELRARLARTERPIKVALMDQRLIAGLGNIYVAEALWRARIHPDTRASALDTAAAKRLARAIQTSLARGLAVLETELAGGGDVEYLQDGGDNPFSVYGRRGERCPRCRTPIAESEHGGRTTFFCSTCQRPPPGE